MGTGSCVVRGFGNEQFYCSASHGAGPRTSQTKAKKTFTLVISSVVRPVAPPTQNCTPGYDPCLTPASDYDCAGGSGDGPMYTGFVRVTGYDPYDLDADGDGTGCE